MANSPLKSPTEGSSGSSTLKQVKWNILSVHRKPSNDKVIDQVAMSVFRTKDEKLGKAVSQVYSPTQLTIVDFAQVRQFVCFAEVVHEISQTRGIQMCRVLGEQCPDKLPEP
jgi:hypothetical protein